MLKTLRTFLTLAFAVWLVGTGTAAFADDFAAAVAELPKGGFAQRAEIVNRLAAIGDARAIPILEALRAGSLQVRSADGTVLLAAESGNFFRTTDPVTGAEGEVAAGDLERIRVNNLVRTRIDAALGGLKLLSPDREERLRAARDSSRYGSPEMLELLRRAIEREQDPTIREAMENGLYTSQLTAGTAEERLAAVEPLSRSLDPRIRSTLAGIASNPDTPADLRAAAQAAVDSANRSMFYLGLLLNLFQGVSLGSILLLAAMGLAITFGVMGVINMAHGEMIMIGAYTAYVVQELFRALLPAGLIDWYLIASLPAAFVIAGLVGIALERGVIRHLYGRPLETLIATWGISLILQQTVRTIFGAPNKEVANPSWMTGGFEVVAGIVVTYNRLYIILFCFVVLGLVLLVLRYTEFGLHMRAVTQNRDMARTMGINSARVDAMTFGLGSGIAGIAGVALSQVGNVSPNLGQLYIVDSFMVVVFGGVGNLAGTLVGAMTLGIVNKFLEPVAGAVLGKVVVLVLIILFIQRRPRGLFALKGRSIEA